MADVLDEFVSSDYLKKFEQTYQSQLKSGKVEPRAQFEYAWCLVRSRYSTDLRKGVLLLEDLFKNGETEARRDYLYYLAVGNAKLKEYNLALKYIRTLLQLEPGNRQASELETAIQKKMEKEGLKGMALAGGAILGVGALIGLGIALAKK